MAVTRSDIEALSDAEVLVVHRHTHEVMEQRSASLKEEFKSGCYGKHSWRTYALAEKKCRNLKKRRIYQSPYKCPHCHRWHIS